MTLSSLAHVKRVKNEDGTVERPPAPPLASFIGSTWDSSGSMSSMGDTPGPALYDWAKDTSTTALLLGQDCFLFATTFSNEAEVRFENVPARDVKISLETARKWTSPNGCTRLYDTAIEDIDRLRQAKREYVEKLPSAVRCLNPRIIVAWSLMTDGMDNRSMQSEFALREAVTNLRQEGGNCYFLAANCDGQQRGADYGFNIDNSLTFDATPKTSAAAFRGISGQMSRVASGGTRTAIPQTLRTASQQTHQQSNHYSGAGGKVGYYHSIRAPALRQYNHLISPSSSPTWQHPQNQVVTRSSKRS